MNDIGKLAKIWSTQRYQRYITR